MYFTHLSKRKKVKKSFFLVFICLKKLPLLPEKSGFKMAKEVFENQNDGLENVEQALSKTELFIEKNKNILMGILIAAIVIILAVMGFKKFYSDPRAERAANEMFKAESYFENQDYEKALNGDGNNLGFLDIISEYGSTKSGNLARYYAGISYLKQGNYNEAIEQLKKFKGNDKVLAPLALGSIGDCYMQLDDAATAVDYYMKAANKEANEFSSPIYLMRAGAAYQILGDNAKALDVYKQLKEKYPNSLEARETASYIDYLENIK